MQTRCRYPAQEISYTLLLGQLQDKGNTDLIKYIHRTVCRCISTATIGKIFSKRVVTRSSNPKILSSCPALYTMAKGPQVLADQE